MPSHAHFPLQRVQTFAFCVTFGFCTMLVYTTAFARDGTPARHRRCTPCWNQQQSKWLAQCVDRMQSLDVVEFPMLVSHSVSSTSSTPSAQDTLITLANTGSEEISISDCIVVGRDAASVQIIRSLPAKLKPRQAALLGIRLLPPQTASATQGATIRIRYCSRMSAVAERVIVVVRQPAATEASVVSSVHHSVVGALAAIRSVVICSNGSNIPFHLCLQEMQAWWFVIMACFVGMMLTIHSPMLLAGGLQSNERQHSLSNTLPNTLSNVVSTTLQTPHIARLQALRFEHLCHDMQARFKLDAERKSIEFSVALAPDFPEVIGVDGKRLRLLLVNVIGSAIKQTQGGFVRLCVEATPRRENEHPNTIGMLIEVSNSGGGITPDRRERIIAGAAAGTYTCDYGGMDVELQVARRLAEQMNGSLLVESLEGVGATIYVLLPSVVVIPSCEA